MSRGDAAHLEAAEHRQVALAPCTGDPPTLGRPTGIVQEQPAVAELAAGRPLCCRLPWWLTAGAIAEAADVRAPLARAGLEEMDA